MKSSIVRHAPCADCSSQLACHCVSCSNATTAGPAYTVCPAMRGLLQGVSVCGDCFNVSGPANASVDFFSYAAQANSTYQVAASWEASYRGPVALGLEAQRPATLLSF